jgi:hypothetical protein
MRKWSCILGLVVVAGVACEPTAYVGEFCGPLIVPTAPQIKVGETVQLVAVRQCANVAGPPYQWMTRHPAVASVQATSDSTAMVTGLAPGMALISATARTLGAGDTNRYEEVGGVTIISSQQ